MTVKPVATVKSRTLEIAVDIIPSASTVCFNQIPRRFETHVGGMAGICGFPSIDTCACVNNTCQGKFLEEDGEICTEEPSEVGMDLELVQNVQSDSAAISWRKLTWARYSWMCFLVVYTII